VDVLVTVVVTVVVGGRLVVELVDVVVVPVSHSVLP